MNTFVFTREFYVLAAVRASLACVPLTVLRVMFNDEYRSNAMGSPDPPH